jgi:hypothetical protein
MGDRPAALARIPASSPSWRHVLSPSGRGVPEIASCTTTRSPSSQRGFASGGSLLDAFVAVSPPHRILGVVADQLADEPASPLWLAIYDHHAHLPASVTATCPEEIVEGSRAQITHPTYRSAWRAGSDNQRSTCLERPPLARREVADARQSPVTGIRQHRHRDDWTRRVTQDVVRRVRVHELAKYAA